MFDPLQQALIDLRDDTSKSKREKQLELFIAFHQFLSVWLDVAPPDAVKESMEWGLHVCSTVGQCACRHHLSEAHLRHGNCWKPLDNTELAKLWTEKDQANAFHQGWLLLLDFREDCFRIEASEPSVFDTNPEAYTFVKQSAEAGNGLAKKAMSLIAGKKPE